MTGHSGGTSESQLKTILEAITGVGESVGERFARVQGISLHDLSFLL